MIVKGEKILVDIDKKIIHGLEQGEQTFYHIDKGGYIYYPNWKLCLKEPYKLSIKEIRELEEKTPEILETEWEWREKELKKKEETPINLNTIWGKITIKYDIATRNHLADNGQVAVEGPDKFRALRELLVKLALQTPVKIVEVTFEAVPKKKKFDLVTYKFRKIPAHFVARIIKDKMGLGLEDWKFKGETKEEAMEVLVYRMIDLYIYRNFKKEVIK